MDELRTALELATDEELQDLTEILFRRKFNPLDYLHTPDPIEVQSQTRQEWLDLLEQRFRFLAADGVTVLKGKAQQVTYRQTLMRVGRHLKLPFSPSLSTVDLEAEIFLGLLKRLWQKLPKREQLALRSEMQTCLAQLSPPAALPLLQHDPVRLLLEGGTAMAVTTVIQPVLLQMFLRRFTAYRAARDVSLVVPAQIQRQLALQATGSRATLTATRYGLTRGVFAFVGSALWVWFVADLGWRTVATNYGRIIPTIFALAQIRLTRADDYLGSECFNPA